MSVSVSRWPLSVSKCPSATMCSVLLDPFGNRCPCCRMYPTFRAPETMTAAEQASLLRATTAAPRDHLLYSMALGTGLRLSELLGLNVGDVSPDGREVRRRVTLDPATTKGRRKGEVFLPAQLIPSYGNSCHGSGATVRRLSRTHLCSSPARVGGSRHAPPSGDSPGGNGGPVLTACTTSTRCGTRRSRTSTGPHGTCSWRRGSRGTRVR